MFSFLKVLVVHLFFGYLLVNSIWALEITDITKQKKPAVSDKEYFYKVNILESDYTKLVVDIVVNRVFLNNTKLLDNKVYKTVYLQGAGQSQNVGEPSLPTFCRFIALPQQAGYKLSILEKDSMLVDCDLPIEPSQEPVPDIENYTPQFKINNIAYDADVFHLKIR